MLQLTLTPDQAHALNETAGDVAVIDGSGQFVGYLKRLPISQGKLDEVLKRRDHPGPWRSSDQVMQRLRDLETK